MPLTEFICPDGVRISTQDCIAKCRMDKRCAAVPTLLSIAKDRTWDGTPHVTSLLNGTMQEYLRVTQDYAVSPDSMAFALLGTSHHNVLESLANEHGYPAEIELKIDNLMQGKLDHLEPDPIDEGAWILWDYKTWGSFRVARALGLVKVGQKVFRDDSRVDLKEPSLQLNAYRVMLEEIGVQVTEIRIQVTVRDGGTYTAKNRGVTKSLYNISVPILDNELVLSYFASKSQMLQKCLNEGAMPPICSDEERWQDNKCKSYCEVAEHCPHGKLLRYGQRSQ
jgi:hypothetical protein